MGGFKQPSTQGPRATLSVDYGAGLEIPTGRVYSSKIMEVKTHLHGKINVGLVNFSLELGRWSNCFLALNHGADNCLIISHRTFYHCEVVHNKNCHNSRTVHSIQIQIIYSKVISLPTTPEFMRSTNLQSQTLI